MYLAIGIVTLIALMELGGISCLKEWSRRKDAGFMVGGVLLYIGVALLFAYGLTLGNLATLNAMWQALAIIVVTVIAVAVYKEKLSLWETCGVTMVGIGVVLLGCGTVLKKEKDIQ